VVGVGMGAPGPASDGGGAPVRPAYGERRGSGPPVGWGVRTLVRSTPVEPSPPSAPGVDVHRPVGPAGAAVVRRGSPARDDGGVTSPDEPAPSPLDGDAVALDHDDPTLLRLQGEVDLHAVETAGPGLAAALRDVEAVDASRVSFIDSMGLHCLITAAVAARERGARVRLVRPSRSVLQMLEITAMADFFDVEA